MIDSILNTLQSAAGNILQLLTYDPKAPMLFSSGLFWVLFLIFLPIYAFLKGSKWKMVTFVVCFSLYFYYKSSGIFFLMLIGTSLVDWSLSHIIYRLKIRNARLLFMWISICFSLNVIAWFYFEIILYFDSYNHKREFAVKLHPKHWISKHNMIILLLNSV